METEVRTVGGKEAALELMNMFWTEKHQGSGGRKSQTRRRKTPECSPTIRMENALAFQWNGEYELD